MPEILYNVAMSATKARTTTNSNTILLIDANAIIHRAYHALPKDLQTSDGTLINAVYGFTSVILQTLGQFKPGYLFFVFDAPGPTFRHKEYQEYKAQRPEMEDLLRNQYPLIKELLAAMKLPVLAQSGYEADDLVGTLSDTPQLKQYQKIVISGDRDMLQLIDADTRVYLAGGGFQKAVLYDEAAAKLKLEFSPGYLVDYKGLNGDPSDNIPGVEGIGHKSATDLVKKYGNLENIYAHLHEFKPALQKKLQESKEQAFLSRRLATIVRDMKISVNLDAASIKNLDMDATVAFFKKMEFRTLISRLEKVVGEVQSSDSRKKFIFQKKQGVNAAGQAPKKEYPLEHFSKFAKGRHKIITTDQDFKDLIQVLAGQKKFVLRCHTIKKDIFAEPAGLAFGFEKALFYLPADKLTGEMKQSLQKLFKESEIISHDAKRDLHALLNLGFQKFDIKWDIMLLAYLLAGISGKYDLDTLVFKFFGEELQTDIQQSLLESNELKLYQEVHYLWQLAEILIKQLEQEKVENSYGWSLRRLYHEVEQPFVSVLLNLDRAGIRIDSRYLQEFAGELEYMINNLQKKIYNQAGMEFNIASPKQLSEVLFGKLKLTGGRKTKTGGYSTNERILLNLINEHPVIPDILAYRELFKLKSTYTQTLIDQINLHTGKLHTTFQQAVAATGRLASRDPNLQNIPISSQWAERIRRAFVADQGKLLVSFDYSQQELRLLADFSGEEKLIETFKQNKDIHTLTASKIFHVPVQKVTSKQRRAGKTVNFGVVYGISAYGLSQSLKIPTEEAQEFIETFYASYLKVSSFFHDYLEQARSKPFVQTILGRRRDTFLLHAGNFQLRSATEREIINFPLQGAAADMMKLAMLQSEKKIETKYADFARMILQVHDELIFSVNTAKISDGKLLDFIKDIKSVMLGVWKLQVPIKLGVEAGFNWHDMQEIKIK